MSANNATSTQKKATKALFASVKTLLYCLVIILSALILSSCGGAAPAVEEPAAEENPSQNPPENAAPLYVLEESIWESNIINVCWENPTQDNQADRAFIQAAIERTWERVSLLDFIGWKACQPESDGIRIQLSDEPPHTKGLGTNIDGVPNGLVLNSTFEKWGCVNENAEQAPCIFPYNGYTREDLLRITAVHEFGHALGFAHEQNRADTPSWCDAPQGENGTLPIGGWDLDSVMNYCNPRWSGDGHLSKLDIAGVQMIYGAKTIWKERGKLGH